MSAAAADNNNNNNGNICANCGKGEENTNSLKACTACRLVKYCNRECQIAHRPQHKKECKKRAAELHEEALFKQPPPQYGDCPICLLRIPSLHTGQTYMSCCGKIICNGCMYAPVYDHQGNKVAEKTCPFCRTPYPNTGEEIVKRNDKRIKLNDSIAIYNQGCYYHDGMYGSPQDYEMALEFYHRAGELGNAKAYYSIGVCYKCGDGVEEDMEKALYYWELAAMKGDIYSRHNLGNNEWRLGNMVRALKHYIIAVKDGDAASLDNIKRMYENGHASKQDYTTALRAYQAYLDEIRSDQRDKAAAADEEYKYY